jgi:uncharacterized protein YecE (DUF72 family)
VSQLYIGSSGWSYQHWKDCFYNGIPRKNWLKFYATHFSAVEINGTFYRLQSPETFSRWFDKTLETFRFVLKAHHYLTYNKKLLDPEASVLIEKSHAIALQEKLAAVLWQLPATLCKDLTRLNLFIQALQQWPEVRHIVEFRHSSWFDDETADCLAKASIANCLSDASNWNMWERVTTDLVYIRLHGHTQTYTSSYNSPELAQWAERIAYWLEQRKQVHVYFDNDVECAAPFNALELKNFFMIKKSFLECEKPYGS